MTKIEVTTKTVLDELYSDSAFTLEGMADTDKNLTAIIDWVKKHTKFTTSSENIYLIRGKVMNENYHLTGNNRYQDNCCIVCIKLSDLEDSMKLAFPRFSIGGRWFDDVVDNNKMREDEKMED